MFRYAGGSAESVPPFLIQLMCGVLPYGKTPELIGEADEPFPMRNFSAILRVLWQIF